MRNVFFDLTEEFNREGRIAVLGSGQAVLWHRLAILSKRLRAYEEATRPFLDAAGRLPKEELALPSGHLRLLPLAERHLPTRPEGAAL